MERIWEPEGCETAFGSVRRLVYARLFLVGVVQIGVFGGGMEGQGGVRGGPGGEWRSA